MDGAHQCFLVILVVHDPLGILPPLEELLMKASFDVAELGLRIKWGCVKLGRKQRHVSLPNPLRPHATLLLAGRGEA